jgi:hypothetical protein
LVEISMKIVIFEFSSFQSQFIQSSNIFQIKV